KDRMQYIQVRHEEAAAFAACGYAKYTGGLGVCMATSGPGGIHLLNGLYDAKFDGQPVLAITGHTFHDLIGTHFQLDVDLGKLYMDVSCYNERIMGPHHVHSVVDARNEVLELAERVGGPIIKALLGKAVVPDDSPYTTGGIGLLGTAPSADAMKECDTLIIVGSSFPYMEFFPKPGQARCVQID